MLLIRNKHTKKEKGSKCRLKIFIYEGQVNPGVQGCGLSEVTPQVDVFYLGEGSGDFIGFVSGAVIYDDDFKGIAQL